MGLTSAAALAGALALLIVLYSGHAPTKPPIETAQGQGNTTGLRPAGVPNYPVEPAMAADLFALPEAKPRPAELSGLAPQYKVGEEWRMRFSVGEASNVVVVQQSPDGKFTRLFPNAVHSSPLVQGGEDVLIPPAGEAGIVVSAPAGVYRVRIGVLPEDVNPLSGVSLRTGDVAGKITVIERSYRVVE
jgi:hypothetical protein